MTKAQLVEAIAARTDLSRTQSGDAVEAVFHIVEEVLGRGGQVSVAGFGKFSVTERGARQGIHPRTGERIEIAATRIPRFTAGSNLKQAVRT